MTWGTNPDNSTPELNATRELRKETEQLKAELDLERRRLASSEELRTLLVDLLRYKDAEIKRLQDEIGQYKTLYNAEVNRTQRQEPEIERLQSALTHTQTKLEATQLRAAGYQGEVERLKAELKRGPGAYALGQEGGP